MHSGWIPWLSASHMKHHMRSVRPTTKAASKRTLLDATTDRLAIGNIGVEWLCPSGVILMVIAGSHPLGLLRVVLSPDQFSIVTVIGVELRDVQLSPRSHACQ